MGDEAKPAPALVLTQEDAEPYDAEKSIAYLRARGVEVELHEERAAKATAARATADALRAKSGSPFRYVKVPAEPTASVVEEVAYAPVDGLPHYRSDTLKDLLAPRFSDDACMDEDTVARATASRLKGMLVGGGGGMTLKAPSAGALQEQALGGVCETWPLAQANADNKWCSVRLYIDEVGALRSRPRNTRAEALARAAGLAGVSIHGDAYVGRCERLDGGGERSVDFVLAELAHDSVWVLAARREHERTAAAAGHRDEELLVSGGDETGLYTWSQGEEDVEVRVTRGIPEGGKTAKKRIAVSYGSGEALRVKVDGSMVLELPKLFARVTPDECSWSLADGPVLVITMEKAEARPWVHLELPGSRPLPPSPPPLPGGLSL